MNQFNSIQITVFLFIIIALNACKKDETPSIQPSLPPTESMQIFDLSTFGDYKKGSTFEHVTAAKALITPWRTLMTSNFSLAIEAFKKASSVQAIKIEDTKWTWTYTIDNLGTANPVVLTGTFSGSTVLWSLMINNVKYLEGKSPSKSNGTWQFYKEKSVPYLEIEWAYIVSDKTGRISYTIVNTNDPERTNSLKIVKTNDANNDVNFTIFKKNIAGDVLSKIEWSSKNKGGKYTTNDGQWLYWDNSYKDI